MTDEVFFHLAYAVMQWSTAERQLVAMFSAFMDHSRTSPGTPSGALSVSALVAPCTVWHRFSLDWAAAMKRGDAEGKTLHMKEFSHGAKIKKGDWVGWDVNRQRRLLDRLLPVVRQHVSFGFCDSYATARWDEIPGFRAEPGHEKHNLTPVSLSLQGVLEEIVETVRPTPTDPVFFFVEDDDAIELELTQHFYAITRVRGWREIFPSLTPIPKGPAPLQAADMVVYEGSRGFSEHIIGHVERGPRGLLLELMNNPRMHFKHATHPILSGYGEFLLAAHRELDRFPEVRTMLRAATIEAEKQAQRERTALGESRKKQKDDPTPS